MNKAGALTLFGGGLISIFISLVLFRALIITPVDNTIARLEGAQYSYSLAVDFAHLIPLLFIVGMFAAGFYLMFRGFMTVFGGGKGD